MKNKIHYEIIGLGDACIDLTIPVSEEFLKTIPGKKGGAEEIDLEGMNKIIVGSGVKPQMSSGGSCANVMKVIAQLGTPSALISHIGSDAYAPFLKNDLEKIGVTPLFSMDKEPTGRVLCLITPDGQRTMRFFIPSYKKSNSKFLNENFFNQVKLVHISCYSLNHKNSVDRAIEWAKKSNALTSIDLASFEIVEQHQSRLKKILENGVDLIFANQDEVKAATRLPPQEGCQKFLEFCQTAIVLIGEQGCLVGHKQSVTHYPTLPAKRVDTTGAGDYFTGGFLYAYSNNFPLAACSHLGNLLGSTIIGFMGSEIPSEKWAHILEQKNQILSRL